MTKVIITGSKGRMGKALLDCAPAHPQVAVVGQVDQGDDLAAIIQKADVVIDFSSHPASPAIAALCAEHGKGIVIGTTGHSSEARSRITANAAKIPMVLASNYSTGVKGPWIIWRKV